MLNTDIKIKSEALVNELDTYVLGLKKNITNCDNIDHWLKHIIVISRKLDQMHNNKLESLDIIVLNKIM